MSIYLYMYVNNGTVLNNLNKTKIKRRNIFMTDYAKCFYRHSQSLTPRAFCNAGVILLQNTQIDFNSHMCLAKMVQLCYSFHMLLTELKSIVFFCWRLKDNCSKLTDFVGDCLKVCNFHLLFLFV